MALASRRMPQLQVALLQQWLQVARATQWRLALSRKALLHRFYSLLRKGFRRWQRWLTAPRVFTGHSRTPLALAAPPGRRHEQVVDRLAGRGTGVSRSRGGRGSGVGRCRGGRGGGRSTKKGSKVAW